MKHKDVEQFMKYEKKKGKGKNIPRQEEDEEGSLQVNFR